MTTSEQTSGQWWTAKGETVTVSYVRLREEAISHLEVLGASCDDAAFIVDVYLEKALQGDHERGVSMLCTQIQSARRGAFDLKAPLRVLRDSGATAMVAGGPKANPKLVCRDAMRLAIAKGRQFGVGCVAAQAKAELLTPFLQQAVAEGMIATIWAQAVPIVAPHGGTAPLLGNAPVGWGIPSASGAPVIVDMSLTQTSAKGVSLFAKQGEAIPSGFLQDKHGKPSTEPKDLFDPEWLKKGKEVAIGSLTPIGSSHKSYALLFVMGLLTSILSDTAFSWDLGNDRESRSAFGTIILVFNPAAFGDPAFILSRVDEYIQRLKGSPAKDGKRILFPGERSQELKRMRRDSDELTLPKTQHDQFTALSRA